MANNLRCKSLVDSESVSVTFQMIRDFVISSPVNTIAANRRTAVVDWLPVFVSGGQTITAFTLTDANS